MKVLAIISRIIPDKIYLQMMFYRHFRKFINFRNPKTISEKIQWLKLYDRKPIYTTMVDKYEAKKYVANIIGKQYIIPTLGVWDRVSEIEWEKLPDKFVLKCTHDSGSIVICKDKETFNKSAAVKILKKGLSRNGYWYGREWPYKNVKRKIIAEKYMVDESGIELKDYKIFCFNGVPRYIQVDYGRFTNHERNLYSTDWSYMGFSSLYPTNKNHIIQKPVCLEEMLEIAKELSIGTPFMRVDLYVIQNEIYFGEITLFHGSGFEQFSPIEWDKKLGDLLTLP